VCTFRVAIRAELEAEASEAEVARKFAEYAAPREGMMPTRELKLRLREASREYGDVRRCARSATTRSGEILGTRNS
jgi:hypothetical protein